MPVALAKQEIPMSKTTQSRGDVAGDFTNEMLETLLYSACCWTWFEKCKHICGTITSELLRDLSINPYRKHNIIAEWLQDYRPTDYRDIMEAIAS